MISAFSALRIRLALLLFLLILPHLLYHFLFETPIGKDFVLYQHRALLRALTYLNLGYFPLWSPWMFSGMSATFEHSLSQVLSPLSWIYLCFPASLEGALLQVILHYKLIVIGLGGCFAFLFFLEISKGMLPSLMGALIFMFNFRMLDNLRYSTPVEILAFLPLLLLLTEYSTRPKTMKWVWIAYPVTLAIMLLSGHPQHNIYNLILVTLYFLFKLLLRYRGSNKKEFWIESGRLCGIFLLLNIAGMALSAPLNLPFVLEVMPFFGKRIEATTQWNDMFKMQPFSLVMNGGFPWFAEVHSNFYSSMVTNVFVLFGFFVVGSKKIEMDSEIRAYSRFFLAYSFFAILYSLGSSFGVMSLVNTLIPVLKSTRCSGRIMGTGIFCLAGAVVFLLKWWQSPPNTQKNATLLLRIFYGYFLAMTLILLSLWGWVLLQQGSLTTHSSSDSFWKRCCFYFQQSLLERYSPISIQSSPILVIQQSVSFFVFAGLFYLVIRGLISEKRKNVSFGLMVVLLLLEVRWYHSRGTWFLERFPQSPTAEWFLAQDIYHQRILPDFEYGEHIQGENYVNYNAPQNLIDFWRFGDAEEKALYGNLEKGKLFVPKNYFVVSDSISAWKLPLSQLRELCFIERTEIENARLQDVFGLTLERAAPYKAPLESDPASKIKVLEHTPNHITFEVTLATPAVVNYLDGYHPGFIATVNEKEVPILKTYGLFKGVFVSAGTSVVSIRYESRAFFWGLRLALGCFAFGVALSGFFLFEQRFLQKKGIRWGVFLFFFLCGAWISSAVEQEIWRMVRKSGCYQFFPRSY